MDTWIIFTFSEYSIPKVKRVEVQAYDIASAIESSGIFIGSITCVQLKTNI